MDTFNKPNGGTELMFDELMRRLPMNYQEEFSIFNYLPYADFNKPTIYWNQLSYDQAAIQFLNEPEWIEKIDQFIFVSHWQAEKFRQLFNIPGYKTHVFKNASLGVKPREHGVREKVRLCYTSTPWRGLEILLKAWEILKPENAELHVFSSCKIYGEEFAKTDFQYEHLYNKCNELPGVVYRGSIPNEELRNELHEFDILAYPNTFEETSCISVIEALCAGLRVVTSNLGALPETTEGWARLYPYLANPDLHAEAFAKILGDEIELIRENKLQEHLTNQVNTYTSRWGWDYRITEWINLLSLIDQSLEKPKYFCMINTKTSQEYTYKSLESFIKNTNIKRRDKFFLIDNDSSFENDLQNIILIKNKTPKSFAENINQVLTLAIQNHSDFVSLNNDIVFTPNWLEPLINSNSITIPLSNQYITDKVDDFGTSFFMDLSQYIGNEDKLDIIANKVTSQNLQFSQPKLIPFYCFYLPHEVSSIVGSFDEKFGKAGGEDIDYRLRARIKGYETLLISSSYLLHFMGKSSWRGLETENETNERNSIYQEYFISKWGKKIANEYININHNDFILK